MPNLIETVVQPPMTTMLKTEAFQAIRSPGSDVSPKTLPSSHTEEKGYFASSGSSNANTTTNEQDSTPRSQPDLPSPDDSEPRRPSITFATDIPTRRDSSSNGEPLLRKASTTSASISFLNRTNSLQVRGRKLSMGNERIRTSSPPYER